MRRVDYINREPVMCFPTPILDFDMIKQDKVKFSNGDFINFNNKSRVPVSTYFYKYNKNLLILDIDRINPIAHIIKNSKVIKTIELGNLTTEDLFNINQVIDINGNELNINSFNDIEFFYSEFKKYKKLKNEIYIDSKAKLQELIESSDRMRKLDKIAGTNKVVDFINEENFQMVRAKLIFICGNKYKDIDKFKQALIKINNLSAFILITNIFEKAFYEDFKRKNKEHIELLNLANNEASTLTNNFYKQWVIEDKFLKEKKLGALFDCLNEMICAKKYSKQELDFVECLIVRYINENHELLDSFIDWVDLCMIEKKEMEDTLKEMVYEWKDKELITEHQI